MSEKCIMVVTEFGEANGKPFSKATLLTTMQSLGRFQEIYMKLNEGQSYEDPMLLKIISQELRNLQKERTIKKDTFTVMDLHDLLSSIRELHLKHIDGDLIKQLLQDTKLHLDPFSQVQAADKGRNFGEYYASLFFNWSFLVTELGYEKVDGTQNLLFELLSYLLSNTKLNQNPLSMTQLCTIVRAISFLQNRFEREYIYKIMCKLEGLLFMQLPQASKNDIIEIIKYYARVFNGGSIIFWKSMDQHVNRMFDQLTKRDIQSLIYVKDFRTGKQYFLTEELMERIREKMKEFE